MVGDVVLTREEVEGLTANLLLQEPSHRLETLLGLLSANAQHLGVEWASELHRHYA